MQEKKKLILIIIFILTFAIINLIIMKPVQAATQTRSTDIDRIDEQKYPGVKQMIKDLQAKHPSWKFKVLYTEIEWYEALKNEYVGHGESPTNLVPVGNSFTGEWICEICGADKYYDNGSWRCASEKTLQYMMDPRASINNSDVFQFMELTYQECTYENIQKMVAGTFLDNASYINAILTAGRNHNVSPYYIVALAIQEQGTTGSSTISGNYQGYEGYYNIFNISASGNGAGTIIAKALTYAQNNEWDTLEKSIDGGVQKISTSYIARGQDTLYLQKFDVDNSDGKLYWHQYQQNVMAAQNEGVTIRKTFEKINAIDSAYTFVIPLYLNMPQGTCQKPQKNVTNVEISNAEKVRVNVNTSIKLRATPNGEKRDSLYANEIVYRLEKATAKVAGTYWDKVMKENGVTGYVARETYDYEPEYKLYLIPIANGGANTPTNEPIDEPSKPGEVTVELPSTGNDRIKVEAELKQVTIVPGTTVQEIINLVGTDITLEDKDGNVLGKTSIPGTGSKINGNYTVVMLGDVNGDAEVNSGDTLAIKQHIKSVKTITNSACLQSADINEDGEVNSGDSLIAKQHIKKVKFISIPE